MIKFLSNLFIKIKYRNSGWCNICEISDTDMKIMVYRLPDTNHLAFDIYDIDPSTKEYIRRELFTSRGNLKYAYMVGFSPNLECEACEKRNEETDKQLDDILG